MTDMEREEGWKLDQPMIAIDPTKFYRRTFVVDGWRKFEAIVREDGLLTVWDLQTETEHYYGIYPTSEAFKVANGIACDRWEK